jgi:beta-phosphoglucomutase-like phosphatase (HAD superfamily)
VRAVLFDLDGTLLDIEVPSFLGRYFKALGATVEQHFPGRGLMTAILEATDAMQLPHPGRTNRDVFYEDFLTRTGVDLAEHWSVFEEFYREQFPLLGDGYGPKKGARRAIETATALGLGVVVATQPIFPRSAIEHRLAWAGLADMGLGHITTYEIMHACKPLPDYFREAAAMVGADVHDCVMVGDDRTNDMAAADIGMRTFYVGDSPGTHADWTGDLDDLADLLEKLSAG